MNDTKAKMQNKDGLSAAIRQEISSDTNRRFLARMVAFRPVDDLPHRLDALLEELDKAEAKTSCGRRGH